MAVRSFAMIRCDSCVCGPRLLTRASHHLLTNIEPSKKMNANGRSPSSKKSVPELLQGASWANLVQNLQLSSREADVLRCMFVDERIAAISEELGLAEGTIHTYRERLFRKLSVRSCAQVIAIAFATHIELNEESDASD